MEKEEIVDKVKHEIIILSDLKEIDQYEIQEYPDMNPSKNDYYFKGSDEEKKKLDERRIKEKEEFESKTGECKVSEEEKLPRQSGSMQWRKDRGEI